VSQGVREGQGVVLSDCNQWSKCGSQKVENKLHWAAGVEVETSVRSILPEPPASLGFAVVALVASYVLWRGSEKHPSGNAADASRYNMGLRPGGYGETAQDR
jgi:hypothetical protein